ncbi:MAG TPA: hypothetical protein VKE74_06240, partial [Gemmataceae bacterium]|nr:hypothetical protein [Gemmataceae bacterium]
MEPRDLIVLTPPGEPEPSLAIAAGRAGARGVLDLEFASDPTHTAGALARLARFAPAGFGVKLGLDAVRFLSHLPPQLGCVILSGNHPELSDTLRQARQTGAEVLIEAVSLPEAVRAVEAGADGLILKGH